jgi:ATP-dependent RNA helicase
MVEPNKREKESQDLPSTTYESSEQIDIYPNFESMHLREELLKGTIPPLISPLGIYTFGFEHPTPIQQRGIVPLSKKRDLILQSPAGTGKTGVFVIGALQQLDMNVREPQVLMLSPTRELAEQS